MNTKPLGTIILVIGLLMMIYTGFTYFTTENVANVGPIHINKEKSHFVSWPPVVGIILFIAGLVMLVSRKKV
ncbi:MAG TPA: hypothetical protein VN698_15215 [Bacteroidia bacterium]|nr:hypothetical protein [Bacteroidia bacterium]